jgi:hypothetical protein
MPGPEKGRFVCPSWPGPVKGRLYLDRSKLRQAFLWESLPMYYKYMWACSHTCMFFELIIKSMYS